MPEGGDEVEAAVHPVVDDVPPVQAALVVQVPLKLLVDVADDGFKAERHKYQPSRDTRGSTPDYKDKQVSLAPAPLADGI